MYKDRETHYLITKVMNTIPVDHMVRIYFISNQSDIFINFFRLVDRENGE